MPSREQSKEYEVQSNESEDEREYWARDNNIDYSEMRRPSNTIRLVKPKVRRERLPKLRTVSEPNRTQKEGAKEYREVSNGEAKRLIRKLAARNKTAREIERILLDDHAVRISLVAISNVRTEMRECLKVLEEMDMLA